MFPPAAPVTTYCSYQNLRNTLSADAVIDELIYFLCTFDFDWLNRVILLRYRTKKYNLIVTMFFRCSAATIFLAIFLSRAHITAGVAGSWSVDASLSQPILFDINSDSSDNYGSSVALHDNVLVVGAYSARLTGSSVPSGKAYIYRRENIAAEWTREAELFLANSTNRDFFGWSVAVDTGVVVVGAYMALGDTASVGLVYVYMYVDSVKKWVLQRILGSSGTVDPWASKKPNWNDHWGSNRITPDFDYFGW